MIAMRGLRPMVAVGFVLLASMLGPPLLGVLVGAIEWFAGDAASPETLGFRGDRAALVTIGWSLAIGFAASWLGLGPGRRLAAGSPVVTTRLLQSVPLPILMTVWIMPILVAPALLFDAWWLEVGPDGWIGATAEAWQLVPGLRAAVLAIGLLGSAIPMAVWAHAAGHDAMHATLRGLDGPRGAGRWFASWRLDLRPVLRVGVLVAMIVAGLTVPFDLAQVGSWGFELRTLDTRGATAGTLWRAGAIAVAVSAIAGWWVASRLARPHSMGGRCVVRGGVVGLVLGMGLVVVPMGLLGRRAFEADLSVAWRLHGIAALNSAWVGVAGLVLGAVVATTIAGCRLEGRRGGRLAAGLVAVIAMVAFMPATLVAIGAERTWNHAITSEIYDGPIAMMLAVGARVAIVPAVLGALTVPIRGRARGGPFALDAPRRLRDAWRGGGSVLRRAAMVGGLAGGVLSMTEIAVTARLQPPGFPVLSSALLNAMHYQYVDSVLPVALPMAWAAIPVAIAIAMVLRRTSRSTGRGGVGMAASMAMLATLVGVVPGCDRTSAEGDVEGVMVAVPHQAAFGRPGNLDGRFDYPRAVAIDASRERVFVVDKSARVQRFGLDGSFQLAWTMPRFENGKPTGISVAEDGRVIVADTHEHRIAIFSPEGELLETHGRMGRGPGEFIYPTDVAAGPDGRWFVSEYGGNDRIQIFDADWTPIGVIGFAGEVDEDHRPALSRPQSMAWSAARGELFIADAIHHRIVVVDAEGRLRRVLGGPGLEPGRFSYPYGVGLDEDGSIVVVEFGANRIQRIHPDDGRCLAMVGGTGIEPGRLRYPWAIDVADGTMAVLDSGNARVLVGGTPKDGTGLKPAGS